MGIKCCWSQVSQDLPFLHPSESSVLNRLCKMGTDYVRFTEFIEQHTGHVHQQVIWGYSACTVCEGRDQIKAEVWFLLHVSQEHYSSQPSQTGLHGIYLRAFCTGLNSMLQPYRQALLDLEKEVLGVYIWSPFMAVFADNIKNETLLILFTFSLQFLGDPHLSISHVNYMLEQVNQTFQIFYLYIQSTEISWIT